MEWSGSCRRKTCCLKSSAPVLGELPQAFRSTKLTLTTDHAISTLAFQEVWQGPERLSYQCSKQERVFRGFEVCWSCFMLFLGWPIQKIKDQQTGRKEQKKTAVTPRRLVFVTCPSAIFRFATLHVLPSTTRLCSLHGLPRALFALQDANAREKEKARSASNDTAKHHLPAGCPTLLSKWVEITWNWDTYYYYSTILVYSK